MRGLGAGLRLALFCHLAVCGETQAQKPIGRPAALSPSTPGLAAPPYRQELISFHKSLVEIESVTGNEQTVGEFLTRQLGSWGYQTETQAIPMKPTDAGARESGTRFNVLAYPGSPSSRGWQGWKPKVLVTSHIDVVPPHIPYSIDLDPGANVTSDTVIRGRGSVDAKASVAAQLIAVRELIASKAIDGSDVMFLFVVGEEADGIGMRSFSRSLQDASPAHPGFDAVIFGEPTENKLACGHKGLITCTTMAKGRAGHSGYPWLGKSANEVLMRGLLAVLDAELGSSDEFGNTTVNVGLMSGGVAANVIPESARASIVVRVAIGPQSEGHSVVRQKIEDTLQDVDPEALSLDCKDGNGYGVVACNCEVEGFEPIVVNYGTDVPNLVGNHTRYLYGPGSILVAHSDHEELRVQDLETAVEGYKKLVKHALTKR
ncbi:acetylornithine deacetylase [Magnaporthiopsis poae ATCC 64411]|uniref:Acetylornithine deacetylase n=1 Tax=Magnaporthiopsis poae (strain ATCC 64411 / 73-15) TaxID=644358 RepID=A0A0C4EF16_MAGP6|nr:acetylornithine deacetylase [Magnaporthiopsis poae ATCC 64411]